MNTGAIKKDLLHTLMDISYKINSSLELDRILPAIVEITKEYIGVSRVSLFLCHKNSLEMKAWAGFVPDIPYRIKLGEGVAGKVALKGKKKLVNHGPVHPASTYRATSFLSMPVKTEGKVLGVLNLTNKNNDYFDDKDILLAEYISSQCALVIQRNDLYLKTVEAVRFKAIGLLRASIAHDVRNMLSIVDVYLSMMEMEDQLPLKTQYIEAIRVEIRRVQGLTSDMLEYARHDLRLNFTTFDLGEVCAEICGQLNLSLKYTEVSVKYENKGSVKIYGDRDRLYRVIFNLAHNGIQAVKEKGSVFIRTHKGYDGTLIVTVFDNGKGIAPEFKDKMFDPFENSGHSSGTGLGLAIVKEIVSGHRGTVKVRSRVNNYTVFQIRLPLMEPSA